MNSASFNYAYYQATHVHFFRARKWPTESINCNIVNVDHAVSEVSYSRTRNYTWLMWTRTIREHANEMRRVMMCASARTIVNSICPTASNFSAANLGTMRTRASREKDWRVGRVDDQWLRSFEKHRKSQSCYETVIELNYEYVCSLQCMCVYARV